MKINTSRCLQKNVARFFDMILGAGNYPLKRIGKLRSSSELFMKLRAFNAVKSLNILAQHYVVYKRRSLSLNLVFELVGLRIEGCVTTIASRVQLESP
jgi:hypothetical protein